MGRVIGYIETGDGTPLYFLKTLDAEGRVVSQNEGSIDSTYKTQFVYNAAGETVQITDPVGRIIHITYSGMIKTVTDPNNHATTYAYNHLPGLPTTVTDAQGHNAVYGYDSLGRLTSVDYNNGARTHSFQYDRADNIVSETHPETGTISYLYSEENWLLEKTWSDATTHYCYTSNNGRLYQVWTGDQTPEEQIYYVYNDHSRVSRVSSTKGWKRDSIFYDQYGNVTSETIYIPGLPPKTIGYDYDKNNNPRKLTYPDGNWAYVTSNTLNMPEQLAFDTTNNYLVDSASYGPGKAVTGLTLARNGTQFAATYYRSGELNSASLAKSGTTLYQASYTYDGAGNVATISSAAPVPTMNATFGYDNLNRLTSATYSSGRVATFSYDYDEYGNMLTVRENGGVVFAKTYYSSNRGFGDTYDARGNLTAAGGKFYWWNKFNQLQYVTDSAGQVLGNYMYDERGLRMMAVPPLPEINVKSDAGNIPDGGQITLVSDVGSHQDVVLTIENQGTANLELTGSPKVNLSGQNADQFSILVQPSSPVLPSGNTTFTIRFQPTTAGLKAATVSIPNNDPDEGTYEIALKGNPQPEMNIDQAPNGGSWDFGTLTIGDFFQETFTIQNLGEANLVLSGSPPARITGDARGEFSIVQQPNTPIAPGGTTTFIVQYTAGHIGQSTGQLSIANNDLDENPYTITLLGAGKTGPQKVTTELALDIVYPDGEEELAAGSKQTITWAGGKSAEFVRLEYSTDNGSTYKTIVKRAPNTGFYDWQVPTVFSPSCLIRISDADGSPASPRSLSFSLNLKMPRADAATGTSSQFTIHASMPDIKAQMTLVADLTIYLDLQKSSEKAIFNGAESGSRDLESSSSEWQNVQITLDLDNSSGKVAVDGEVIFENVPLVMTSLGSARPEIIMFTGRGALADVWIDDFEVRFQDRTLAPVSDEEMIIKPIIRDTFDRYLTGIFPGNGGWLAGQNASENPTEGVENGGQSQNGSGAAARLAQNARNDDSPKNLKLSLGSKGVQAAQATGQAAGATEISQGRAVGKIDEAERTSPLKSFRLKGNGDAPITVIKKFMLPEQVPYDVSSSDFSIVADSPQAKGGQRDAESSKPDARSSETSRENPANGSNTEQTTISRKVNTLRPALRGIRPTKPKSSGSKSSGGTVRALSASPVGSYYIYGFDGRLLAEYDTYGFCLKNYIYMGNRLIAEYDPLYAQYYYYTQDQVRSTQVVTNDLGTVVYAEAHDPYGGIQKTWADTFEPQRKFSDKERDEETGLDYFGARYYANSAYRWISVDPVLTERALNATQEWNLYSYSKNNPETLYDPDGRAAWGEAVVPVSALIQIYQAALGKYMAGFISTTRALNSLIANPGGANDWIGTPYDEIGKGSIIHKGGDCAGINWAVIVNGGYDYEYEQANKDFINSLKKGHVNAGILAALPKGSPLQWGDIGYWDGHMVMYAYNQDGEDYVYNASGKHNYKIQQLRWIERDSFNGVQPIWFRLRNNPASK